MVIFTFFTIVAVASMNMFKGYKTTLSFQLILNPIINPVNTALILSIKSTASVPNPSSMI